MKGYKFLLWKKYFDTGYGLSNYVFKLIAVFGLASQRVGDTFIILGAYSFACFIVGRWWLYSDMLSTETEIQNMFNPFVTEMRKKFKIKQKQTFK